MDNIILCIQKCHLTFLQAENTMHLNAMALFLSVKRSASLMEDKSGMAFMHKSSKLVQYFTSGPHMLLVNWLQLDKSILVSLSPMDINIFKTHIYNRRCHYYAYQYLGDHIVSEVHYPTQ